MYWRMLRRELLGRKKQTAIVASGLAVAVALVMVVSSLTNGVQRAQAESLESVYGVGTDLTVTATPSPPDMSESGAGMGRPGGPRFDFADGEGSTLDGVTTFAQSQLNVQMGSSSFDSAAIDTVTELPQVASATGTLALNSTTFSGEMPDLSQMSQGGMPAAPEPGAPSGGMGAPGGSGGSSFGIDSFSVLGVDPGATVGPIAATTLAEGRALTPADQTDAELVAVLDSSYATTQELTVGGTVDLAGHTVEIVGIVSSTGSDATTAADVFVPLATAQQLADLENQITTVSVSAASVDQIATVQTAIAEALPDTTVSSQEDLAATLSGSLSTTTSLITNLGTWLSVIVLAVAVILAILLTSSGVSRRTREFGTLKALGWSNRRVMSQVAGESTAQALIGGIVGIVMGGLAILALNLWAPTIGGNTAEVPGPGQGGMGAGMPGADFLPGGGMAGFGRSAAATEITLNAPINLWLICAALALSLAGGLIAALFGAWRVSRLSPAEALRAVA